MSVDLLQRKADAIAASIAQSEVAREFWQAKQKMEKNTKAQELFEQLKLKTNERLILAERLAPEHPKMMLADLEIHEIEDQLQQIPVAIQYKTAQAELNEMMQGVVQVILRRLADEVPVELGPRQGCGQGHGGSGCDCNS